MSLTRRERRALMQLEEQFGTESSDAEILWEYERQFTSGRWWHGNPARRFGPRWLTRCGWLSVLVGAVAAIAFLTSTTAASFAGVVVMTAGLFVLTRRSAVQGASRWVRDRFGPPATGG